MKKRSTNYGLLFSFVYFGLSEIEQEKGKMSQLKSLDTMDKKRVGSLCLKYGLPHQGKSAEDLKSSLTEYFEQEEENEEGDHTELENQPDYNS